MVDNEVQDQSVEATELQQSLESQPESPIANENTQDDKTPKEQVKTSPYPTSGQPDNFRLLRERLEQEKRQREAMEKRLAEIEAQNKPKPMPEEDFDFEIGADEIAEGKHLTKVGRKMKQLEQKIAEVEQRRVDLQRQSEETSMISSIKADFPDIDKVVNETTMEMLRTKFPHIERAVKSSPDLYGKAAAAYQAIKEMGIYVEDTYVSEKERVQRNVAKPKPTAAVASSGSALSQADMFANGLTPELKDKLHKEMIEAMKAR
jgi:hypothetical protein